MDVAGFAKLSDGVIALLFFVLLDAPVLLEGDGDAEHRRRFDFPDDFVPSLRHSESVIAQWERERVAGVQFAFAVRSVASGELLGGWGFPSKLAICAQKPPSGEDARREQTGMSALRSPERNAYQMTRCPDRALCSEPFRRLDDSAGGVDQLERAHPSIVQVKSTCFKATSPSF